MVRVLNFFFLALSGLACLALYHVSEQARVAGLELSRVNREIASERDDMSVLQAEWARVADPSRIQKLAQSRLGLTDTPTVELSSLQLLPRRGEPTQFGDSPVRTANDTLPVKRENSRIRLAAIRPGN